MMKADSDVPEQTGSRWLMPYFCTIIGMIGNLVLTVGKLGVGFFSRSTSLVADGFHSLSDVASDIGIMFALRASQRPADEDHPYGHHSFETLGALFVAALMLLTAILIGRDAVLRLIHRDFLAPETPALVMAIVAVVVKELMARYTILAGRIHNSPALLSNGAMHRSDAISSLAAAGGILGARLGLPSLDSFGALAISLFILKMGFDLMRSNLMTLVDTMPGPEVVADVTRISQQVAGVQEVRDIKVRQRGSIYLADLRVAIHPDLTIVAAHEIAHDVEKKLLEELDHMDHVFVHVEPGTSEDKSGSSDVKSGTSDVDAG